MQSACGKMGWLVVSLRNYKKDHCSLTLLKNKKEEKERKPVPVFHLEEQTFFKLSFPPWTFNLKKKKQTNKLQQQSLKENLCGSDKMTCPRKICTNLSLQAIGHRNGTTAAVN